MAECADRCPQLGVVEVCREEEVVYHYVLSDVADAPSIVAHGLLSLSAMPESRRRQAIEATLPRCFRSLFGPFAEPILRRPYRTSGVFLTPIDFRRMPGAWPAKAGRFALPPGRPEEFHLPPPTDSGREPLDSSGSCEPCDGHVPASPDSEAPGSSLSVGLGPFEFAHPLRSMRITRTSSLLRDGAPPASASLLSPFAGYAYRVFTWHHRQGSHVLYQSQDQARAHCTPDAVKAVSRFRLHLSGGRKQPSILTSL